MGIVEGFFNDNELQLLENEVRACRDASARGRCGVHESTLGLLARCALQVDLLTRELHGTRARLLELEHYAVEHSERA